MSSLERWAVRPQHRDRPQTNWEIGRGRGREKRGGKGGNKRGRKRGRERGKRSRIKAGREGTQAERESKLTKENEPSP